MLMFYTYEYRCELEKGLIMPIDVQMSLEKRFKYIFIKD